MSRRILLADDSVTIQKVIELTFMDDDYEVRAVGNGDEALAMLTALKVDFVIADVHMPGASGYEVCRRSKQLQPEVPVLLLVGTFEPFNETQARESGADSYLKKPFDSQELLGRVHELLAAAKPEPSTAQASHPTELPREHQPATETLPPIEPLHPLHSLDSLDSLHPLHSLQTPPAGTGDASAAGGAELSPFEAAESWQEFELEAEPEVIPEPWQPPPAAAEPKSKPEQSFALGDIDEPAEQEALPVSETPPAAAASAEEAATTVPGSGARAAAAPEAPHQPFTLGEPPPAASSSPATPPTSGNPATPDTPSTPEIPPIDDGAFLLDEPEPPAARSERLTTPEPILPFPMFSGGGRGEAASPVLEPPESMIGHGSLAPIPVESTAAESDGASVGAHGNGRSTAAAPSDSPMSPMSASDVDRIARRVVELIGDSVVRDIAWEVIPDLAEVVIKDRLRELESQIE